MVIWPSLLSLGVMRDADHSNIWVTFDIGDCCSGPVGYAGGVHGVNNLSDEDIEKYCGEYRTAIESLRDGQLLPENLKDAVYINDVDFEGGSHA